MSKYHIGFLSMIVYNARVVSHRFLLHLRCVQQASKILLPLSMLRYRDEQTASPSLVKGSCVL